RSAQGSRNSRVLSFERLDESWSLSLALITLSRSERFRHVSDDRIERGLVGCRIFKANMIRDLAFAGRNDLLIEYATVLASRKGEPITAGSRIGDCPAVVAVIGDKALGIVRVFIVDDCRKRSKDGDRRLAVRRSEIASVIVGRRLARFVVGGNVRDSAETAIEKALPITGER